MLSAERVGDWLKEKQAVTFCLVAQGTKSLYWAGMAQHLNIDLLV